MPKILLGARKRRAEVTSGMIDSATLARSDQAVRDASAAYDDLKDDPIMYADLLAPPLPSQKLIAEAVDFNVRHSAWLYQENLNFSWRGNVRVAIKGRNGGGKSTLLKAVLGKKTDHRGELRLGDLKSLYIDQSCSQLDESISIFENLSAQGSLSENEVRNHLAKFLFYKESVFQLVASLSGGERLRATLALGLLSPEPPRLLVLDEPTNNLDLKNVEFLENLVREFQGALLVVSHDEHFIRNCHIGEVLNIDSGGEF